MIIVGLGNPGSQYKNTRHNVGFMVLDGLAKELSKTEWLIERGVLAIKIGTNWLIKPQQFMNDSGSALRDFLNYHNIKDYGDVLVVHDDVDFPIGDVHQQSNRSAAGHNGVQSVIDALGTQNFSRLRIGIGSNRDRHLPAEEYVLQKFTASEQSTIDPAIKQAISLLQNKIE